MGKKQGGAYARRRGHGYERDIANRFKKEGLFPEAKRHLESQYQEAMGYDLDNTGKYYFQLKRNKKYAAITKIEEVQLDKLPKEAVPILITKGDKQRDVVVLYLDDFITLLKKEKAIEELHHVRSLKDE